MSNDIARMIENTVSQGRAESSSHRIRKRRDKIAYHNTSRVYHRTTTGLSTTSYSPGSSSSPNNGRIQSRPSPEPQFNLDFLNFLDGSDSPSENSSFAPIVHQNGQVGDGWQSASLASSYTLASPPPNYLQPIDENSMTFSQSGHSSNMSNFSLDLSWNGVDLPNNDAPSDMDDVSMSDVHFGSYGSYGSFGSVDSMALETPNTATSSMSEAYVFPIAGSPFGSPRGMNPLVDLKLQGGYFQTGLDPPSPGSGNPGSPLDDFPFESEYSTLQLGYNNLEGVYSSQGPQSSTTTLTQLQLRQVPQVENPYMISNTAWNSEQAQISSFVSSANPGCNTFEPERGSPYFINEARQEYLDADQPQLGPVGQSSTTVVSESEDESWAIPSYSSSYAPSQNSPQSQGSPLSHAASPLQIEMEHHHVFSSMPGIEKTKATKGRQRNLTTEEKKHARDVRFAKACWACHLSKTKCSPCSPGKPCEQCTRLLGKRRFCKFDCFNEPLESLVTFLVPDYTMGHFTRANVESFVAKNASGWGSDSLLVRMNWGYRKLLEANVVTLAMSSNSSQLGYSHQAISEGSGRPVLERRKSPPLGIPLADMLEMQDLYNRYLEDIVDDDLPNYVSVAYDDQESLLPQRLLDVICTLYQAWVNAGRECDLLRQAIEIHITFTIIERSLVLDSESINKVRNHLQEDFPAKAVPRCAQRQIKLAFFLLQQQRIVDVLKSWGNIMWTIKNSTGNQNDWAMSFSVLLVLTLAIDKVFGSAYWFCEGRIKHYDDDAAREKKKLEELVTLTERELFERCKEIFHWKFKTRKGGKEACNPIRDGMEAFRGKPVDDRVEGLVWNLKAVVRDFEPQIKDHRSWRQKPDLPYTDAGRLACIFLDDFLDR